MHKLNVIGIDLAKSSFHAYVINSNGQPSTDKSFNKPSLTRWLAKQKPSLVAFEACGSAHYWAQKVMSMGHQAMLLSAKSVTPFRQGHKTDKQDARAIAVAACQPEMKSVAVKNVEQQALQSIERIRQHYSDSLTATSNLIRGLLYEFGITIPKGKAALRRKIPEILEDAENQLPDCFRAQLHTLFESYKLSSEQLKTLEGELFSLIKKQSDCKRLLKLEGVGPVNALGLWLAIGEQGGAFKNGREASACIGVTPKQYTTGNVVVLGGISKKCGNRRLRSSLIQGAMSVVKVVEQKPARNQKEKWLKALIERAGKRRAAVALANKTIRTAWAVLRHEAEYRTPAPLAA